MRRSSRCRRASESRSSGRGGFGVMPRHERRHVERALCRFFGTPDDHAALLTWLVEESTCHVYEWSSDPECPLKCFSSSSEVIVEFDRTYDTGEKWNKVYLQLYVLGA